MGEVRVFVPPTLPPPGLLRQAASECRVIWKQLGKGVDPIDISLFPAFFRRLYARNLDEKSICEAVKVGVAGDVRFRDVSEAFKLIDDQDGAVVLVRYQHSDGSTPLDGLLRKLEADGPERCLMRKLQRYAVTIYRRDAERLLAQGEIRIVDQCPGLYVQHSDILYHPAIGLVLDGAPGDPGELVV